MYFAAIHYKGLLKPNHFVDVIVIDPANVELTIELSPAPTTPSLEIRRNNPAATVTAVNSDTFTGITARDVFQVRILPSAVPLAATGADLIITARDAATPSNILQREVLRINNPTMRYKRVGALQSFASNIAMYNAKRSQIQKLRGKSYIWNVGIVPDVPTSASDEVYIGLPITQPFDISFSFEEIAYGQGSGMRSTGEIRIPLAMLEPTLVKAIAAKSNELMDAIEQGRPNRGFAMVEFFNEKYSIVLNDVPINATIEANANGADPNNESNMGVITIDVSGKSVSEILAGFNEIEN